MKDYPLQPSQAVLIRQLIQAKQQADRDLEMALRVTLAGHGVENMVGNVELRGEDTPPALRITEPEKPPELKA